MQDSFIFALLFFGYSRCIAFSNKINNYSAVKTAGVVLNALRQAQGDIRGAMLSLSKHFLTGY